MVGVLIIGLLANLLVRPVDARHHERKPGEGSEGAAGAVATELEEELK